MTAATITMLAHRLRSDSKSVEQSDDPPRQQEETSSYCYYDSIHVRAPCLSPITSHTCAGEVNAEAGRACSWTLYPVDRPAAPVFTTFLHLPVPPLQISYVGDGLLGVTDACSNRPARLRTRRILGIELKGEHMVLYIVLLLDQVSDTSVRRSGRVK